MYVFKGIEYKPKITGKSQVGDAYMPCNWKYQLPHQKYIMNEVVGFRVQNYKEIGSLGF